MSDLRISLDGRRLAISPMRALGESRFGRYRSIVRSAGAVPHPTEWRDYCLPIVLPEIYRGLLAEGFRLAITPDVPDALRETAQRLAAAQDIPCDPRAHPYQREGIAYLRARHRAILADEMGLGKTMQLLTAAHPGAPMLVICPALAKGVWKSEAHTWTPERKVYILAGKGSFRWPRVGELVIINYDVLPPAGSILPPPPPGMVLIGDESHYCKGASARTRATAQLVRSVIAAGGRAWGATGTPLANWPPDLWRVLDTFGLAAGSFGTWPRFVNLFGGTKDRWGRWSWTAPHSSVPGILSRVMLRRTRAQVLPQLPPKSYASLRVPMSESDTAALDRLLKEGGIKVPEITETTLGRILRSAHIMAARKILATAKIKHALAWAETCEDAGEPVVVFSAHRAPVLAFQDRPGWRTITGDIDPAERTKIAAAFQAGELKGIAATIDAGGVAITLTRACLAMFVDLEWTPAANSQAEDRLMRIGQKRPVTIYRLTAEHALDERVDSLLKTKTATLHASVEAITSTPDGVLADRLKDLADQIELAFL